MTKHQLINLFPLTLYKSRIELSENQKKEMISEILEIKGVSGSENKRKEGAWTGFNHEKQDLLHNNKFNFFFNQVSIHIKNYLSNFKIKPDEIGCYFLRSWATVSDGMENIRPHSHAQSHLTFAFYLNKSPEDSNIQFTDHIKHNEFIPASFVTESRGKKSIFEERNINNVGQVDINCLEGDIIIFPSKTIHSTQANKNNKKRISISADIMFTSKNKENLEFVIPSTENWKKF